MTPKAITAFGSGAISSTKVLIVGGNDYSLNTGQPSVNIFDLSTGAFEQIATLENECVSLVCGKITLTSSSPPGGKAILCTLGRTTSATPEKLRKTYVYYIRTGRSERREDWDFPSGKEDGIQYGHVISGTMYVRTGSGVFVFRDNGTSSDPSMHWTEVPEFAWPEGASAEFDLKYIQIP